MATTFAALRPNAVICRGGDEMNAPVARMLDANRLHLQHGPIDLIIEAWGADREVALEQAAMRFENVLTELVAELDLLRQPLSAGQYPNGTIARRMAGAVAPFDTFITPMAAVAGAVADEVLAAMVTGLRLERAYVNNGGDIAVWLAKGQHLTALIHDRGDAGRVALRHADPARGVATSGRGGRSHSLGIADAVTVLAHSSAAADAAATLIANAVDLPGHPGIDRVQATDLSPDSDLGSRLVTRHVTGLSADDIANALDAGQRIADRMLKQGQIEAAALFLKGETRLSGAFPQIEPGKAIDHARIQTAQDDAVRRGYSP